LSPFTNPKRLASRDYDPGLNLEKIRAPRLAINFADDLINPLEFGMLEREIKRRSAWPRNKMPRAPGVISYD
jgi:hypothetical protein